MQLSEFQWRLVLSNEIHLQFICYCVTNCEIWIFHSIIFGADHCSLYEVEWGKSLSRTWSMKYLNQIYQSVVNSFQLYYLVLIKLNLNLFDKTLPQLKRIIFKLTASIPFDSHLQPWNFLKHLNIETQSRGTGNIFRLLKAEFCSPHNGEYNVK